MATLAAVRKTATMNKGTLPLAFLALFLIGCSTPPGLRVSWEENMLRIDGPGLGTDGVEVWYLEAYCRRGSTDRPWGETTIPHRTEKLEASPDNSFLRLRCQVEGGVEVVHEIRAGTTDVDFRVVATNRGSEHVDAHWVQPCMRVGEFTGRNRQGHVLRGEEEYMEKCFIFLDGDDLTPLHRTRRASEARYKGGQVYVPAGIDRDDVNPRPLSPDVPSNGLIGCFSADDRTILAMAWEPYQELFQGVILCIHSDFRLGGLAPGETKTAKGKIYVVDNDVDRLLELYRRDFEAR